MTDLSELEKQLAILEDLFKNSIGLIQKDANLKQNFNEPNLEASSMNAIRIKEESIDTNKNYIDEFAIQIEESLTKLEGICKGFREKEEYLKTDEELLNSIKVLEGSNNSKLEKINEALNESKRIADSIESNRQILMFPVNQRRFDDSMNIDKHY